MSRAFGHVKAEIEKRGVRIEDFDVAVASHALSRDAVLVMDDIQHMSRVPRLRLENWTEPSP